MGSSAIDIFNFKERMQLYYTCNLSLAVPEFISSIKSYWMAISISYVKGNDKKKILKKLEKKCFLGDKKRETYDFQTKLLKVNSLLQESDLLYFQPWIIRKRNNKHFQCWDNFKFELVKKKMRIDTNFRARILLITKR